MIKPLKLDVFLKLCKLLGVCVWRGVPRVNWKHYCIFSLGEELLGLLKLLLKMLNFIQLIIPANYDT